MVTQIETRPRYFRQRQWATSLSEIVTELMRLLALRGQEGIGGGAEFGEAPWTERNSFCFTPTLHLSQEGNDETGPYRLTVSARTTEDAGNWDEPLLKLEIRPNAWWFNEVKATINDPGRIEKPDAAPPAEKESM